MEVVQLATNHQVRSNAVPVEKVLPAGTFSIRIADQEQNFRFGGGKISDLLRQLRTEGAELFDASSLNPESGKTVISLRSKTSGERGRFVFADPEGLLQSIGFVGPAAEGAREAVQQDLDFRGVAAFARTATAPAPSPAPAATLNHTIEENGASLRLQGVGAMGLSASLPEKPRLSVTVTRLSAPEAANPVEGAGQDAASEAEKKSEEAAPATPETERISTGPEITVEVGDIELRGYQIERERRLPASPAADQQAEAGTPAAPGAPPSPAAARFGVGYQYRENGELKTREEFRDLSAAEQSEEISLDLSAPGPVERIYFFSEGGAARFHGLRVNGEKAAEQSAVNETQKAQDAILRINGIEVRRPQNQQLTGVLQGVSLNLNRPTDGPVQVEINVNADEIMKQIVEWAQAHNELVIFCRDNSRTGENDFTSPSQPNQQQGEEGRQRQQAGIFASDATIRQLLSSVRLTVSSAYPMPAGDGYRVLSDIGLSTGEIGESRENTQLGILVLNEEKLRSALTRNPEGVRQLFASDSNEDNLPDSGVAISLERALQPYTRTSGGVISTRVDVLKEQIRSNKREMDRKEMAVQAMESQLRERFGRMERAVQQNRAMGEYLRRNSPSGGN